MKVIYQPIAPFFINQHFGDNKACVSLDGTNNFITCDGNNPPPGYKSLYGERGHLGLDLRTYHGQPVFAAQTGRVYFIDANPQSGLDVRIESEEAGLKFRHIYEHLLGYQPRVGDEVQVGQVIGWADNTGWSSGDHLHFQVETFVGGIWTPVDPLMLMEPIFAPKILAIEQPLKSLKEKVALLAESISDYLRKNKTYV